MKAGRAGGGGWGVRGRQLAELERGFTHSHIPEVSQSLLTDGRRNQK